LIFIIISSFLRNSFKSLIQKSFHLLFALLYLNHLLLTPQILLVLPHGLHLHDEVPGEPAVHYHHWYIIIRDMVLIPIVQRLLPAVDSRVALRLDEQIDRNATMFVSRPNVKVHFPLANMSQGGVKCKDCHKIGEVIPRNLCDSEHVHVPKNQVFDKIPAQAVVDVAEMDQEAPPHVAVDEGVVDFVGVLYQSEGEDAEVFGREPEVYPLYLQKERPRNILEHQRVYHHIHVVMKQAGEDIAVNGLLID